MLLREGLIGWEKADGSEVVSRHEWRHIMMKENSWQMLMDHLNEKPQLE